MMGNKAEEIVSKFYNEKGWSVDRGVTEDAKRWEDLREYAQEYVSKCRLRVLRHIPEKGINMLDMASGPIQYKEYLEYSRNFEKRYCVDLSKAALDQAREKIGDHGVLLHGSFFDIFLENDFFDCSISLHTIYHIDKDKQEDAVRKLIRVTKPGKPVIVVYSNPNTLIRYFKFPFLFLRLIKRVLYRIAGKEYKSELYSYAHPIKWWDRFSDMAEVKRLPWRSFNSGDQKRLIPNIRFGKKMLNVLYEMEERFPKFFVKYFEYPMVILTKKKSFQGTSSDKRF
jgi:ubiquinone/menaquinone biosynthesis C-methylase UbiE